LAIFLDGPFAIWCSAPAWQSAFVMGKAIIAGKFFVLFYFPQGIKFHMAIDNPHISIGAAAMVHIP